MWRLLGTVHAENDNDPAAISAMMRAHKVQVNSRTHVPQKLTGPVSLCTNPVSILSVRIQTVPKIP